MTQLNKRGWLSVLLLMVAWALPVLATAGELTQPHVVLVGISDYNDPAIKDRAHAEDDAKALYDLVIDKKYLGAAEKNVRLLLGKKDPTRPSKLATRENVLEAVQWLAKDTTEEDLVIFAFFGQGCSLGKRGDRTCYLMVDSTLKNRTTDALAAAELEKALEKLKSHSFCVFLDLNFKGFDAEKLSIPEASLGRHPYQEFLGDDGSLDHMPKEGRTIFLATNGLTTSPDLEDHGLFAKAVLEGLKGAADKYGFEPDGLVTVPELRTYIDDEIPALKRKHNKITDNPRERTDHFVLVGHSSRYALSKNPKVTAKVQERLTKFKELAKKLDKDLADEGVRLLERMPKLEAYQNLRKEYQKFVDGSINAGALDLSRKRILSTMQLPPTVATKFAIVVMRAIRKIGREYVKKTNPSEMVVGAIRGIYARIDEKLPQPIEERLAKAKDMSENELMLFLRDVRAELGKREDLDDHKDIDHALQRMLARLDPYTTYIDPEMLERFKLLTQGELSGIGVQIRKDPKTEMLEVVTPLLNSPSHRQGLQEGDLIETVFRDVDSEGNKLPTTETLHTKDLSLNDAVKKIIGKAGTKVKLKIRRPVENRSFLIEITRDSIDIESVVGVQRNKDQSWDYVADKQKRIGYVRLSSFAQHTTRDLERTIQKLKAQGMRGLVLDLRFNPGGLLTAAREISDMFIDRGLIVSIRPRDDRELPITGERAGSELDFPMVVLVNGDSASASEIVSACLQDHGRAIVAGERSYGKGSVQTIDDLDGGKLKFTTATFWRPNGKNLNKSSTEGKEDEDWGVRPNSGFLVELSQKERMDLMEHQRNVEIIRRKGGKPATKLSDFEDRQLEVALKYLGDQIADTTRK